MEPRTRTLSLSFSALFCNKFHFFVPKGFLPLSEKEGRCLRRQPPSPHQCWHLAASGSCAAGARRSCRCCTHGPRDGRKQRGIRCEMGGTGSSRDSSVRSSMGGTESSVGSSVRSTRLCSSGMARSRLAQKCRLASGQGSCSCHDGSCTAGLSSVSATGVSLLQVGVASCPAHERGSTGCASQGRASGTSHPALAASRGCRPVR